MPPRRPKTIASAETVHRGVVLVNRRSGRLRVGCNPSPDLPNELSWSPAEAVIGRNSVASRVKRKQLATIPCLLRNDLKRVLMGLSPAVRIRQAFALR